MRSVVFARNRDSGDVPATVVAFGCADRCWWFLSSDQPQTSLFHVIAGQFAVSLISSAIAPQSETSRRKQGTRPLAATGNFAAATYLLC